MSSKLLTFYKEGYTYAWDIKQKVAGKNIQYVKLYPIDSGAEIKNMLLGIDTSTNHIYRLIQTDAKGTQFILTVKSFKPNQKLTPDNFAVDLNQYQEQGYYINTLYQAGENFRPLYINQFFKDVFKRLYYFDVHFCTANHLVVHLRAGGKRLIIFNYLKVFVVFHTKINSTGVAIDHFGHLLDGFWHPLRAI